jgi:stage II sporulation protein D
MYCRKILLTVLVVVVLPAISKSADLRIGLFYGSEIQSVVFSTVEGEYLLYANDRQIATISKGIIIHIEKTSAGLELHDTRQSYGVYPALEFKGVSATNTFQVRPVFPALNPKESDGDLSISYTGIAIRLINRIDMEKYVSGTVESEGGSNASPEFYKAQAVIVRTFAVKNYLRHVQEGFNLCDGVHCQAYNGITSMNKEIYTVTQATKDEVLVDGNGEPVIAAYHACCGGITGRASYEWQGELPYLVPVIDPFCRKSKHSNWVKAVTLKEWDDYLKKQNYANQSGNPFKQSGSNRQKYLDPENKQLLLTGIREYFELKSSFFNIEKSTDNSSVIFHGHGYGHGLGMCQEGAMEMARVGYTYTDILMFYFRGLELKKRVF